MCKGLFGSDNKVCVTVKGSKFIPRHLCSLQSRLFLLQEKWHPGPAEMNARTTCGFNRSGLHLAQGLGKSWHQPSD